MRRKAAYAAAAVLAGLAAGSGYFLQGPLPSRNGVYNIIIISIDALRPDHLGCYGYDRPVSPAMDRLAAAGTRFARASAQASWTLPSSFSFLTGLYPSAHGLTLTSVPPAPTLERNYHFNTFTLFKNHGYAVRGLLNSWYGVGVLAQMHPEVKEAAGAAWKMDLRAKWFMACNRRRPFFLQLHYMEVHSPYRPRPAYIKRFGGLANTSSYDEDFIKKVNTGRRTITARELEEIKTNYDGNIAYMDDRVGELMDWIEGLGLTDRTIVVVTADHGDAFMEHGRLSHSLELYDEVMRIPLIMVVPGPVGGRVVSARVQSIDLLPTLLDLNGFEIPGHLQGRSLAPLLRGEAPADLADRDVFAEMTMDSWYYFPDHLKEVGGVTPGPESQYVVAAVSGPWKMIHYLRTDRFELFNLEADPGETQNLAESEPAAAAGMKLKLDEYFDRCRAAGGVDIREEARMTDAEVWKRAYEVSPRLSREVVDQLKGLGYIQ